MKDIRGFGNYSITENGRVFSKDLNRFLRPYSNGLGYRAIKLRKNGIRIQKYIHRLVVDSFFGLKDGLEVNHKDGNKENNNLDNLEQVTRQQNQKHAYDNGLLRGFVTKYKNA